MQCPVFGQKRKERKRIRWRFRPSGGFAAGFAGTVTIPVSLPDMSARTRNKTTAAAAKTAVPIQEAAAAVKQEGKRKGLCLQKARPFFAVSMACGGLVRKATGSPLSGL